MILIAATALGIAWAQAGWDWMYFKRAPRNPLVGASWEPLDQAARVAPALLPCLATWTMALLLLRFTPPRPRLRRLVLQPGTAACAAAALGLITSAVDFGLSTLWWWLLRNERMPIERVAYHSIDYLFQAAPRIAVAIGAVWIILAASRRLHAERGWIDRLGRLLGALWVAMAICRGWAELVQLMTNGMSWTIGVYWKQLLKYIAAPGS
jgi:hypothetical protein